MGFQHTAPALQRPSCMCAPEIFQVHVRMKQSLRLSSKCEDHFFNSSLNHSSQNISFIPVQEVLVFSDNKADILNVRPWKFDFYQLI